MKVSNKNRIVGEEFMLEWDRMARMSLRMFWLLTNCFTT